MTNQGHANVPEDIQQTYREMGIWTEQQRQVFRHFAETEVCFKWQDEPTGPITTSNRSTPLPDIRQY